MIQTAFLIFSTLSFAQTPPPSTGGTQVQATSVKDAKESCKKAGKEGKELLLCIKEKTKK